jgi:hypothetical protein
MAAMSHLTYLIASSLAAVGCLYSGAALAQEPWEHLLRQQLNREKACVMSEVSDVTRMRLGEQIVISGRAACYDGRLFDFSQQQPHMRFDIQACDPTVC